VLFRSTIPVFKSYLKRLLEVETNAYVIVQNYLQLVGRMPISDVQNTTRVCTGELIFAF
jgi:hypothetical protein